MYCFIKDAMKIFIGRAIGNGFRFYVYNHIFVYVPVVDCKIIFSNVVFPIDSQIFAAGKFPKESYYITLSSSQMADLEVMIDIRVTFICLLLGTPVHFICNCNGHNITPT